MDKLRIKVINKTLDVGNELTDLTLQEKTPWNVLQEGLIVLTDVVH